MSEIDTAHSDETVQTSRPSRKPWLVLVSFGPGMGLLVALDMN